MDGFIDKELEREIDEVKDDNICTLCNYAMEDCKHTWKDYLKKG